MARLLPRAISEWDSADAIPLLRGEETSLVVLQLEVLDERPAQQAQDRTVELVEVPHIYRSQDLFGSLRHGLLSPFNGGGATSAVNSILLDAYERFGESM
jgi:hypothetical protein